MKLNKLTKVAADMIAANPNITVHALAEKMKIEVRQAQRLMKQIFETAGTPRAPRPERRERKEKTDLSGTIRGKVEGHRDGYAFFIPEEGRGDAFIHPKNFGGAVHGDTVLVRIGVFKGRKEAVVVKIIERGIKKMVGIADVAGRNVRIIPFSNNFTEPIYLKGSFETMDGDVVVCRIDKYPEGRLRAVGVIEEKLGHITDVGIDNKIVMYKYGLTHGFPEDVRKEAAATQSDKTSKRFKTVTDFREMFSVTIDGETARDYDDAISVEIENGNYVLYVHIADVSRYVRRGSALDLEAKRRGTSVYFPEFALPMLPEELSNGICSLLPNEDRYTATAKIIFSADGEKLAAMFYRSVIRSRFRLTYKYVNECLAGTVEYKSAELASFTERAKALADILGDRRKRLGGIDFDLPEAGFTFSKDGRVSDIYVQERGFAERMIEYFMIAANEAVASFLHTNKVPSLYRVHDEPDVRKVEDWIELARGFGLTVPPIEFPVTPESLKIMASVAEGSRYSQLLGSMLVRSMMRAEYSVENKGHFGLASDAYTHFTSPIRRYPDLLVHRALFNKLGLGDLSEPILELAELAASTSKQERAANDSENEISQFKKLEYLEINEAEEFDAYINRISQNGIFVYVEKLMMTGFISYDYIKFDEFVVQGNIALGLRTSERYKAGDRVRVRMYGIDVTTLKVDFEFAEQKSRKKKTLMNANAKRSF